MGRTLNQSKKLPVSPEASAKPAFPAGTISEQGSSGDGPAVGADDVTRSTGGGGCAGWNAGGGGEAGGGNGGGGMAGPPELADPAVDEPKVEDDDEDDDDE